MSVSNTGSYSDGPSPWDTYYNVFDPQVQAWVTNLVLQIADRYANSPALAGVAIRLMGWQFSGMFDVSSLNWGYEDYTIDAFRTANPGLNMPNYTDSNRFAEALCLAHEFREHVHWNDGRTDLDQLARRASDGLLIKA